ncbi:MAG: hypothetical protein GH144_10340 [Clostridia bacterium]|jgi:hypothetical protein|nr:hypothetical protein [Clostridia bacterium]
MPKKTGLGDNPLDWIADTSKQSKDKPKNQSSEPINFHTPAVPKFRSFEVKLSILLRENQLGFLEKLTREIMTSRDSGNKKERITKNTIIRTLIDALKDLDINKTNIPNETELLKRIREKINP